MGKRRTRNPDRRCTLRRKRRRTPHRGTRRRSRSDRTQGRRNTGKRYTRKRGRKYTLHRRDKRTDPRRQTPARTLSSQSRSQHTYMVSPREKWLTETNAFISRRACTHAQTSRQTQGICQSGWTGDQFRQTQYRHWSRGRGLSRKSRRAKEIPYWLVPVVAQATTSTAFSEICVLAPERTRSADCSSCGRMKQRQGEEELPPQPLLQAVGKLCPAHAGQQGQHGLASANFCWV